jgi:glucose/arabinose dehydrogenase
MLKLTLAASALLAATPCFSQLPPGDGPTPANSTLLEASPVPFASDTVGRLKAPQGFTVSVFAKDLKNVRWLQVAPNGDVYASRRDQGDVLLLRDTDGDGAADQQRVVAQNITYAHGLALHDGKLYIASDKKVLVAEVSADGSLSTPRPIIEDLPDAGQHPNRTLAMGPDGWLYITAGSSCNNCRETNPEAATVLRARPDGSGREVFAAGLRNTIGFGWHPVSKALYGFDHGSDFRGDDIPPEELNEIRAGKHYGWPWCYGQREVDRFQFNEPPNTTKADFCPTTEGPALTYTAHAAPIGMVFYDGSQFPAGYRGSAFVAMRGSWNRAEPSGFKVIRVTFDAAGRPTGTEDFITGWLVPPPGPLTDPGTKAPATEQAKAKRPAQLGRLAGLAVARDGSLLIAEDQNGVIYRVRHGNTR